MDEQLEKKKRYSVKTSSRGGARPNSGRPKGMPNKISAATILASIEQRAGQKFEDLLAEGYVNSIVNNDVGTRIQYEKMFLGKVVADKVSVEVNENQDLIDAKKAAFIEALSAMTLKDNVKEIK